MSRKFHSPPNSAGLAPADTGLLARLVHASPAVLYSCRVAGDCGTIAVTDNVQAVFGYTPEDFLADPSFWAVRIHPEDAARVFEEMPGLFREGGQAITYRFRHALGHYVTVRDQMRLEFDEDGQPARILGCWLETAPHQAAAYFAARMESRISTETMTNTETGGTYAEQT
jgi:PAS domain-containing protein